MTDPDANMEEITSYQDDYPYFTAFLTGFVVVLYVLVSLLSSQSFIITLALVTAGVYFWVEHTTKVKYDVGEVSRGYVYFVLIGGMFLVLFANFLLCASM